MVTEHVPPGAKPEASFIKYTIAVSGAAVTDLCSADALQNAAKIGRIIAERNMILVTGATHGTPYWAAKGAKEAGGFVIGLSPAASEAHHVKTYRLPTEYHDLIVYTGFDYAGRDLFMTRASDGVITVCGRMGSMHEFSVAFEDQKPQGVLIASGGIADMLEGIVKSVQPRGAGAKKLVFDRDPEALVDKVIAVIRAEKRTIRQAGGTFEQALGGATPPAK